MWCDDALVSLKPGTVVWYQFQKFPFWPAVVDTNEIVDGKREIVVNFFDNESSLCG